MFPLILNIGYFEQYLAQYVNVPMGQSKLLRSFSYIIFVEKTILMLFNIWTSLRFPKSRGENFWGSLSLFTGVSTLTLCEVLNVWMTLKPHKWMSHININILKYLNKDERERKRERDMDRQTDCLRSKYETAHGNNQQKQLLWQCDRDCLESLLGQMQVILKNSRSAFC